MSPIFLAKDSRVLISTYGMQYRADIWGQDVNEFRPERWDDEEKRGGGWDFVPFAGGPRKCIGRKFNPHPVFRPCQGLRPVGLTR